MPSVMLRKREDGKLLFYVAKKDLEETIESLEFDSPDKWGGEVVLGDGSKYFFDILDAPPKIPLHCKRNAYKGGCHGFIYSC
ncbi:MAG: putative nitrogen fixation protein NifT [Methylococcaceae bacterium]|nr:putative nitrogen fixation protein NifT [Methylococcaceae bacterium]